MLTANGLMHQLLILMSNNWTSELAYVIRLVRPIINLLPKIIFMALGSPVKAETAHAAVCLSRMLSITKTQVVVGVVVEVEWNSSSR